jgi:ACDE family multidrug resistance protein
MTESVMQATELPRAVASSTYSGIRFVGGAIAPAIAGVIADHVSEASPYWLGAAALVVSIVVLVIGRRHLAAIDAGGHDAHAVPDAAVLTAADA